MRGDVDPGELVFRPRAVGFVMYGGIPHPGMGPHFPWLALALHSSPSTSAIGRLSWGFHTVRGGIDPGITFFILRWLELERYGRISRGGVGTISDRVSVVGVSAPFGAVSTRGNSVFVPVLLEL